jgi:streptogrisin C
MNTMSTTRRAILALAAIGTITTGITATSTVVGAQAGDGRLGNTKPASVDDADVQLAAKQFGWDIAATAAHLNAQASFGLMIDTVATKFPKSYAGAVFAEVPGAPSQVMIKGDLPADVARIIESSGLKVEVVSGMEFSSLDQQQRSAEIIKLLGAAGYKEVGTAVLADGQIQVAVSGTPKTRVELPPHLTEGVEIVEAPDGVVTDEAAMGGQQVFGGGAQCTSGFSVRRISDGTTGVSTAAHCTGMNTIVTPSGNRSMSFRNEHNGAFGDMEWHTTVDTEIDNYMASPTDERDVSMVWPSNGYAENMVTCVFSRMQGTRSCDQIYSTSVSSLGSSNLIATDNDSTVGGDSGGPWSFNSIADGIHKGDKWIWFGTRNVFSRAGNLPAALGVAVMT